MKKILFTTAFAICVIFTSSANSSYYVNDSEVETLLEESIQINPFENATEMASFMRTDGIQAEKNVVVALILNWFLGGIAIHRVYLGGTPVLIAGYFFTFGGIFGLLWLGDLIALIINSGDISRYVDSNAFIMW